MTGLILLFNTSQYEVSPPERQLVSASFTEHHVQDIFGTNVDA